MKNTVIEKLENLSVQIKAAEAAYVNACIDLQKAKDVLTETEAGLILSGKIDGKNAEVRQAQMVELTKPERAVIREEENRVSTIKARLNSLIVEFKAYRSIARLLSQGVE